MYTNTSPKYTTYSNTMHKISKIVCNEIRYLQLYSISNLSAQGTLLGHNRQTHANTASRRNAFKICFIMGCALINNVGLAVLPFFS